MQLCGDILCSCSAWRAAPLCSSCQPRHSAVQIVSDRDKATRAAALGTLEVAYLSEGQAIWSMLGRLSDQQHSLIEERFKYTDKQVRAWGT